MMTFGTKPRSQKDLDAFVELCFSKPYVQDELKSCVPTDEEIYEPYREILSMKRPLNPAWSDILSAAKTMLEVKGHLTKNRDDSSSRPPPVMFVKEIIINNDNANDNGD